MKFNCRKLKVEISFRFIAVVTLMLVILPQSKVMYGFAFCILHEFGHLLTMLICGVSVREISFDYYGVRIVRGNQLVPRFAEILILLSGTLVNFVTAIVCSALGYTQIGLMSLALGVLNILPASVLDGGMILRILISENSVCKIIERVFCVLAIIFGIAVAVITKGNFTLLIVAFYILLCSIKEESRLPV